MGEFIVVLSGAGMSADSGLATFRGAGGLWEGESVESVATPEAFRRDPERVLRFYNQRREQLAHAHPNAAHNALAALEARHQVAIITQNVDDLHERAGSSHVVHLHGKLTRARSSVDPERVYEIGYAPIRLGDQCDRGTQLRPDVVWFGEMVPMMEPALALVAKAERILVVGTSLQVYPAAGLLDAAPRGVPVTVVDPQAPRSVPGAEVIAAGAAEGVPRWAETLG